MTKQNKGDKMTPEDINANEVRKKFDDVTSGKITEEKWKQLCVKYFKQILSQPHNQATMKRLKDRGD